MTGPVVTGHPRVGGEHAIAFLDGKEDSGSSPRGRGTHVHFAGNPHHTRVIPAWAGNTTDPRINKYGRAGHPRVGGEHTS